MVCGENTVKCLLTVVPDSIYVQSQMMDKDDDLRGRGGFQDLSCFDKVSWV